VAHLRGGRQRQADEERDEKKIGDSRQPTHEPIVGAACERSLNARQPARRELARLCELR
jgi:hypothetical protein